MPQPNDEHLAAILAQLRTTFDRPPEAATKSDLVQLRRARVLVYYYANGLTTRVIATMEGVDQSQISRDLKWWQARINKDRRDPDILVGDLELRYETIYQGALQDVQLIDQKYGDAHNLAYYRDRARCRMVALHAARSLHLLRAGTGRIRMVEPDDPQKGPVASAAEIRRLADEVRKLTGQVEDPKQIDLTAPGERAYLEGDISAETAEAAETFTEADADGASADD
jgi:hypothetical protein